MNIIVIYKNIENSDKIKDIHSFVGKMFPIAIVKDNRLFVFDIDSSEKDIFLLKNHPLQCRLLKKQEPPFLRSVMKVKQPAYFG
ncbi:MAG: hypothetical protein DRN29_08745 [Thermoplasmata archaeon]|nr:MAG: hypothetical protein DRN29_08745 [Thermoplasmata archaeon]